MIFCVVVNLLSYFISHTIGRLLHENSLEEGDKVDKMFIASTVAIVRVVLLCFISLILNF